MIICLLGCKLKEIVHSVIKFVISRHCKVIAHVIHNVGNGKARGEGADNFALYSVTCVNGNHIVALAEKFRSVACKGGVAVNIAVNVVCIKNNNIPCAGILRKGIDACKAKKTQHSKK